MPGDLISLHEVKLLLVFKNRPDCWFDNAQVAEAAQISPRTARLHTSRLVELGVLDVERVFPASKFKLSGNPPEAGATYLTRWEKARVALGLGAAVEATEATR